MDTTEPYYFDFDTEWQMLSFRIPRQQLLSRLAGRTPRTGMSLDGTGAGGAVTALMTALWQVGEATERTTLRDLEQALASAVAAATAAPDTGAAAIDRTALRAAVMQHVRDHLTDRALSVATVCRRFAISPRTLHNVFAGSEDSFAATVRAQRLDSCADLLADPQISTTITDIAAAHGFDDPTSFSRAFRRRFGTSPDGQSPRPARDVAPERPLRSQAEALRPSRNGMHELHEACTQCRDSPDHGAEPDWMADPYRPLSQRGASR